MTEQSPPAPPPSPPLNPLQAALAAVEGLSRRVTDLTDEVKRLRSYGRRNRTFVVIDIILTVAVTVVTYVAVDASLAVSRNGVTISQLHSSQVAGCIAGNQTRAQEIQLWSHLAAVSKPAPGATPKQIAASKKEIAALLAYIRHTFAARPCRQIYAIPGGKP